MKEWEVNSKRRRALVDDHQKDAGLAQYFGPHAEQAAP